MLSDEEREALRNFKSEYETCDHYSSDLIIELDDAEIILNLIENQSNEIEELKKYEKYYEEMEEANKKFLPVDKIKAKIEEIDEEIKVKREIAKNPMDRVSGRLLRDKEEIKTMVEEIEEKLKEYYEFLTIEVEYAKIKTYKIFISVTLTDYRNSDVIKGVEFYYNWEDHLAFTANIEQMRYNIEKAIIKFFRKEDKNDKK